MAVKKNINRLINNIDFDLVMVKMEESTFYATLHFSIYFLRCIYMSKTNDEISCSYTY
jgi:hypothetical protein